MSKKINHNILPTIQGIGVILIVLFALIVGGKIDQQQEAEASELRKEIFAQELRQEVKDNAQILRQDNEYKYKNGEIILPDNFVIFDTLVVMDCEGLNNALITCDDTDSGLSDAYYYYCAVN